MFLEAIFVSKLKISNYSPDFPFTSQRFVIFIKALGISPNELLAEFAIVAILAQLEAMKKEMCVCCKTITITIEFLPEFVESVDEGQKEEDKLCGKVLKINCDE